MLSIRQYRPGRVYGKVSRSDRFELSTHRTDEDLQIDHSDRSDHLDLGLPL